LQIDSGLGKTCDFDWCWKLGNAEFTCYKVGSASSIGNEVSRLQVGEEEKKSRVCRLGEEKKVSRL